MAFSPDGKTLATSGPALWRLADGQRIWPIAAPAKQHDGLLVPADNWVAFSPDGSLLLVSDFTGGEEWLKDLKTYQTVTKLYRTRDGALVRDLGTSLSRRPTFSPDGAWIVAGSFVYPVLSGAPVILGPIPVDSVSTFAPDGTIAVGGTDGITRLFCPR
jgi:WD40 repeat protein